MLVTRKASKKGSIGSRAGSARGTVKSLRGDAARSANLKMAELNGNGHASVGVRPRGRYKELEALVVNGKPLNGQEKQNGHTKVNGQVAAKPVAGRSKSPSSAVRDRQLVERCLAGEVGAWSAIYRQCHDALLLGIRVFLGRAGHDSNLVEEIAARTWYAVVRDGFSLLDRFDAKYGCRLTTFLSLLAKTEARLLFRSERRRKKREHVASRPEMEKVKATGLELISDDEFIATLTPSERMFCFDVLFAQEASSNEEEYTRGNRSLLRHRIRRKLERFLE